MNTITALAQSSETTGWMPTVVVIMLVVLVVVMGLAKLVRRILGVVTGLLVSAAAALTGIATVLAGSTVLTTLLLVYVR
jgi:hypothetical protein